MELKDLLVHLDSGPRAAERLGLAVALARRHGARLTGLFAERTVLGGSLVGRRDPANVARAAAEAQPRFETACATAGVTARWWALPLDGAEDTELIDATVVCCRRVDLPILGQQHGDPAPVPDGLVERVIAGSGRPVLVVPSIGSYPDAGRRVIVAWTGSREAARALHDALPLLERAERVTVLSLLQGREGTAAPVLPPLDVAEHLRAHGVEAAHDHWLVGDLAAVDAVLNRASDEGADLTVIGAHGLLGQGLLGGERGTTRAILETMTTPVLLSA
jgi:nucleotide-binding universal stress UspA family protein